MNNQCRVLIVGAGHAGGTVASVLRDQGHIGPITLLGDEADAPYNRPPLSKAFLQGKTDLDALLLKNPVFYQDQQIEFHASVRAERLIPDQRKVILNNGQSLAYDKLILATGARPRALPIPGTQLPNVLVLRTAQDASALKTLLEQKPQHLVLIGGGYIGLELAASALGMGHKVTVLERENRLLARVASEPLAEFFHQQHAQRGATILLNESAQAILGETHVEAVQLSDGSTLACDIVVIGAGVVPNIELAQDAGIRCSNGIEVNLAGQTSEPDIYAIGDVSLRPLPMQDNRLARVESVPNAMEQARLCVADILGLEPPKAELQWFWSDQYEYKLQIAGMAFDVDTTVVRGDPASGKFSILRFKGEQLQCAECVNSPVDFIAAKALIVSGAKINLERVSSLENKLKDCVS